MIERSVLIRDLAAFADLGTDLAEPAVLGDALVFRMFRDGQEIELRFQNGDAGKIIERSLETDAPDRTHASYRALLASPCFGNLGQWANYQDRSFRAGQPDDPIPVKGHLSGDDTERLVDGREFDDFLVAQAPGQDSVRIILIDGPAGIGKTTFIESLARSRAKEFLQPTRGARRPLILHVQSRGRVLTYLQDLIAFSLQSLRLNVTFDQFPVLVRTGLVTMAIDGFDELADPNGYDLAWAQVNEFIDQSRGSGTLILAGRETFIDRQRIRDNIRALRPDDPVDGLSLQLPEPETAKEWLIRGGAWTEETIGNYAGALFEPGSYALRPVFLKQLATHEAVAIIKDSPALSTLSFLVDLMIRREAEKFGDAVNSMMNQDQRRHYVWLFHREVARYLADDQTDAVDDRVTAWLADMAVEMAAPTDMAEDALAILKHRASAMAFLDKDDLPGYRRFLHSQVFHHFLADDAIDTIANEEMPKYIRRNLLGADFLTSFSDLILYRAESDSDRIRRFFGAASGMLRSYSWIDRGVRNLGALLMAALPALDDAGDLSIRSIQADEALIQGTAPAASIRDAVVSQLDVRGADLRDLTFDGATIVTLIADDATRVSSTFPTPDRIQVEGQSTALTDREQIGDWLGRHGRIGADRADGSSDRTDDGLVRFELRSHPMMKLLGRVCRIRSHSFSEDGDLPFQRFTQDRRWPSVRDLLKKHGFLEETTRPTSGPKKALLHVKRAKDLLAAELSGSAASHDDEICGFFEALVAKMREDQINEE